MIKRIALMGAVLTGAALLLAALGWYLIKPQEVIAAAQREIEARTGTRLTYAGAPAVTLWPEVMVSLDAPVLTAAGGGEPVLKAKTLRLKTSLESLMRGDLASIALTLEGAHLNLIVDGSGKSDLITAMSGPEARLPVELQVKNSSLAFLDERSGAAFAASDIDAAVTPAGGAEGIGFKATLTLNRQFVRLEGALKSLKRLAEDGSPLSFTLEAPALKASFDGRAALARGFNLAGQVVAETGGLGELAAWAGVPAIGGGGPARLTAAVDASPGSIELKQAVIGFEGNAVTGEVALGRGKGRPHLTGIIEAAKVDLAPLLALVASAPGDKIGFQALSGFDASLELTADAISIAGSAVGEGKANATLTAGVLDIRAPALKLFGGEAALQIVFDGSQPVPAVLFAMNARSLNMSALAAALGSGALTGSLSAEMTLAGSGGTAEELLARMKGRASAALTGGQLNGIDMKALASAAGRAILDGIPSNQGVVTPLTSASAACKIADGIALCDPASLETPEIKATGKADIDFLRRDLALTLDVTLGGKPLPAKLTVQGPWGRPRVYPNVTGILDNPEAAFAALKKLDWPAAAP